MHSISAIVKKWFLWQSQIRQYCLMVHNDAYFPVKSGENQLNGSKFSILFQIQDGGRRHLEYHFTPYKWWMALQQASTNVLPGYDNAISMWSIFVGFEIRRATSVCNFNFALVCLSLCDMNNDVENLPPNCLAIFRSFLNHIWIQRWHFKVSRPEWNRPSFIWSIQRNVHNNGNCNQTDRI